MNLETSPRRTFSKSTKLDNVLYDVRGPVVDEANRMERNGTHILKLSCFFMSSGTLQLCCTTHCVANPGTPG